MNCLRCHDHWELLHSAAGWYIGTQHEGVPVCRVTGYWLKNKRRAEAELIFMKGMAAINGVFFGRASAENEVCPGFNVVKNG